MRILASIVLFMSAPLFHKGEAVQVRHGEFIDCVGLVSEIYEKPQGNYYDLEIFQCPTRWIKGQFPYLNVEERELHGYSK